MKTYGRLLGMHKVKLIVISLLIIFTAGILNAGSTTMMCSDRPYQYKDNWVSKDEILFRDKGNWLPWCENGELTLGDNSGTCKTIRSYQQDKVEFKKKPFANWQIKNRRYNLESCRDNADANHSRYKTLELIKSTCSKDEYILGCTNVNPPRYLETYIGSCSSISADMQCILFEDDYVENAYKTPDGMFCPPHDAKGRFNIDSEFDGNAWFREEIKKTSFTEVNKIGVETVNKEETHTLDFYLRKSSRFGNCEALE